MSAEQTESGDGGLTGKIAPDRQPEFVGKYRIDGVIGRGAVGVVYRGYDEQIDRPLAIKTLRSDVLSSVSDHENLLQRFSAEARSAGRCLHPNIVTVFDYVEFNGSPYIVMEYVDAGTLENVINSGAMLPLSQVGEIMGQLLFALGHAHSNGVVHRDVKPANILCPTASTIKVTDFGVARLETLGLTNPGGLGAIGTPNYMSPEQFLGRPVDGRADLFSAGVIMYQLLAGAKPFLANDIGELMRKLLNESAAPISTMRPGNWNELDAVVRGALARNPEDRFQDAQAFMETLDKAIQSTGSDNTPPLDLTKMSTTGMSSATHGTNSRSGGWDRSGGTLPGDMSQTMSTRLAPATLNAVEKALAKSIGPIARVVVRKASMESTDPDMLLSSLSDQIPIKEEATRFRKEAESTIRADQGFAMVHLDALITTEDVQAAGEALVPFVGPVAGMLAKRQAKTAVGHEDYFRRLGDAIPDERQRAQFLDQMRKRMPEAN